MVKVGSIVRFKVADGVVRPAIVVRLWSAEYAKGQAVQLQVFVDGTNDSDHFTDNECQCGLAWKTSVAEGEGVGQFEADEEAAAS